MLSCTLLVRSCSVLLTDESELNFRGLGFVSCHIKDKKIESMAESEAINSLVPGTAKVQLYTAGESLFCILSA